MNINSKNLLNQQIQYSVHIGQKIHNWEQKMAPYLLYLDKGYYIFDLIKAFNLLKIAENIVTQITNKNGKILFVANDPIMNNCIKILAKRTNAFYITSRWRSGLITNWKTNKTQILRFNLLENLKTTNYFQTISKRDASKYLKELSKLKSLFEGIQTMTELPDIVICINQTREMPVINECLTLGIPIISIMDSNGDPTMVPYPIIGNIESINSISFILNFLTNNIINTRS